MESSKISASLQSPDITLDNDVLSEIFSYLDQKSWLTARCVCRNWNDLALSLKRIPLVLRMDHELLGNKFGQSNPLDPRLHRRVLMFNEHLIFNDVFSRMKVNGQLECIKQLQISIFSQAELNVFATVLNFGGIPNLQNLDLGCQFEITQPPALFGNSFAGLKTLRIREHSNRKNWIAQVFYKSIMESAASLRELTIGQQYDIRENKSLRRLSLDKIPMKINEELVPMNWDNLGDTRLNLTTLSIRNCLVVGKIPVFPNVQNLDLFEFQGEIPNIKEAFPKLRKLTAGQNYCNLGNEKNTVKEYLKQLPASLEVVELTHVRSAWTEDVVIALQNVGKELPSFKLLKLISQEAAGHECSSMEYAFSVDVPHLMFDMVGDGEGWFPQMLYWINEIEKPIPKDTKQGLVTFCNTKQRKKEDDVNDEYNCKRWTELVEDFPRIISPVLSCWERVEFRNVVIRERLLSSILWDIEKHKFNIEVFHGTSICEEA